LTPVALGAYKGRDGRCERSAQKMMNFHEQDRISFGGRCQRM
jgi:hypothetical protein